MVIMDNEKTELKAIDPEAVAKQLLWPLWLCVNDEYKSKYRRDVWEHFENAVRSAAYTGLLRQYITNFQARIPCTLQVQHIKSIQPVIDSGMDYDILCWLRDETSYMVMHCRLMNQDRKELRAQMLADLPDDYMPEGNTGKMPGITVAEIDAQIEQDLFNNKTI